MGFLSFFKNLFHKTFFNERWTCSACGKEIFTNDYFCEDCLKTLPYNTGFRCEHCGRATSSPEEYCLTCRGNLVNIDCGRSVFLYTDKIKSLIKKMKYHENAYLSDVFAKELSNLYFRSFFAADAIVFVPMTAKKEKKNGYNHARALAISLSKIVDVPVLDVLIKNKETKKQALLKAKERKDNLKGAFKITDRKQIKDKRILIVDDVTTTGSTAETLAELLKKANAKTVYVLTVASVKSKESI